MLILVTGGLGAVGSHLVAELRGRGHDVWINDLRHHHDPKYLRGDVGEYRQLERVVTHKKFELVYHLAAEFGRWNGEDFYETMWQSNVIGTKNLIRLQEKLGFRQIFFSSSEVYGDYEGVMSEDVMDKHEIKQMNDYAISKWVSEMQILNSATMHGTESVRVRLFNTYGPGETYSSYRSVICQFTYAALNNLPYKVYDGHTRTSTYITDMVVTLSNIAERFKPGEVYNVAGTSYHDIRTVSDLILKAAGKTDKLVTYSDGEPFTTKHKKVDASKAVRDLGHAPKVGLEEGIANTVKWMRAFYGV
ncbi:MAG TPA: NAD(P)-dependent oxidoreductase [Polyangia bacterium]|nr:NAD(P)-dependent oxidoreductase [Polyangia bacterium]